MLAPVPIEKKPRSGVLWRLVGWTTQWWQANVVLGVSLVLTVVVGGALLNAAGEIYEAVSDHDGVAAFDRPLLDWILTIRTPALTGFVAWFSNTGGPVLQPLITGLIVVVICWRWRSWTPLVLAALASAGALAATVLGKDLVGRMRPPLVDAVPPFEVSPSFPSGHTLNATVVAGILCYLALHWFRTRGVRTLALALCVVYALAMGLSRVYLGHHWLTDVLAGWTLGTAWVLVVVTLHRIWLTARQRHGEQRWFAHLTDRERSRDDQELSTDSPTGGSGSTTSA